MPGAHGGRNTDKDYAPHMWIGDHFVGNNTKEVRVGKWLYRVGATSDKKIVAERSLYSDKVLDRLSAESKPVPDDRIPKKVREAITENAFAEGQAEIEAVAALFNNSPTNKREARSKT
jgi:hypothetical protein